MSSIYDSKYIESDAFLMACESDTLALEDHLRQFTKDELKQLRDGAVFLKDRAARALEERE
jgi:hypothetical protein